MESYFSSYFLPVTLAFITLGMGLSVTLSEFKNIFTRPKALSTGLISQMVILPLIAFLIAALSNLDPFFKVGLVIIASCPGGATSNLITYILSGNVALSISLTVINSLITLLTIPFIVNLGLDIFIHQNAWIHLPVLNTIGKIFLLTILPAYTGIIIRNRYPRFAERLNKPLKYILPGILLLMYLGVIFIDRGAKSGNLMNFTSLFLPALILNSTAMIAGWLLAKSLKLGRRNQMTISIEVGLQNSALAIFVSSTLLNNNDMALVAVVYGSFTFFTTFLFGWLVKKLR